jgi:hypothetical protein
MLFPSRAGYYARFGVLKIITPSLKRHCNKKALQIARLFTDDIYSVALIFLLLLLFGFQEIYIA